MLVFPREFFDAEERCDFTVDVTMKTVWAAELEVLCEIALVCEKYNIPWYMAYGSLLGAVRHEGFVPWDDDIDICLLREDYQRLLELLPEELPEGYVVRSPLLGNGYPEYQSCVANSSYISIEPEHLQKFHGCPFVVGVDIFPIDALPRDKNILERKKRGFQLIRKAAQIVKREPDIKILKAISNELKTDFDIQLFPKEVYLPENEHEANELAARFWRFGNEIVMYPQDIEVSDKVCVFTSYVRRECQYDREWFKNTAELPFEGFGVPVPGEYDKVLTATYGDYHVLKRGGGAHDYPFYKKQLEDLRKRVEQASK